MARRLESLKLLNMDRWKAHLDDRARRDREVAEERAFAPKQPVCDTRSEGAANAPSSAALLPLPLRATPVPTAGELFSRSDPLRRGRGRTGIAPRDNRRGDAPSKAGNWRVAHQAVPTSGDDFAPAPPFSTLKYRAPVTSVTRKQGDCRLFGCCGWRWTAVSRAAPKPPFASRDMPHPRRVLADRRNGSGR